MEQAIADNATPATQRMQMYTAVHKGLRAHMSQVLALVGRTDPTDDGELAATLAQVRELVEILGVHLAEEDRFLHSALEARMPGASASTAEDHVGHELSFDEIEAEVQAVERAGAAQRASAMLNLYRRLARFVAENFEHMHVEETHNQMVLWATWSEEELLGIHQALVASVPPQAMQVFMKWMLQANPHSERVALLAGMREGAPAEVFEGALALARAHLPQRDWAKLARALQVPAEPGLVEAW